jgi:hypothetical protein
MDGLSVAASVIAVLQLTAEVIKCLNDERWGRGRFQATPGLDWIEILTPLRRLRPKG